MKKLIFVVCVSSTAKLVTAQELSPDPYESRGVCPFECYTYREWTADASIDVHENVASDPAYYTACVLANVSMR